MLLIPFTSTCIGGETTLTFKRRLATKDEFDLTINNGTARIHWGWTISDLAPNIPTFPTMEKTGVVYNYLIVVRWHTPLPKHYKTWDIRIPNNTVAAHYNGKKYVLAEFPDIGKQKNQIIRVDSIIPPTSTYVVHHMMLYKTLPGML